MKLLEYLKTCAILTLLFNVSINCSQVQVNEDIVIDYENKNTSFLQLAGELNATFTEKFLAGCELNSSRSCLNRCGEWERHDRLKCYCDDICQDLGDCCYDYNSGCRKSLRQKKERYSCFDSQFMFVKDWGFIVVSKCPAFINQSSQLARVCVQPDPADIFQQLPVFDKKTNISYRNYFCARCNQVVHISFWKARRECKFNSNTDTMFNLSSYMKHYCKPLWMFSPPENVKIARCLLHRHAGWYSGGNSNRNINWKMVKRLCEAYFLPVCHQMAFFGFGRRYNNPHCLLCGHRSRRPLINWHCLTCPEQSTLPTLPGIQLLFDFSSTSQFKVNVGIQKTVVVKTESCSQRQVYDPFSRSCRDVPAFRNQFPFMKMETPTKNSTSNISLTKHCLGALLKDNEVNFLSNGSVYIISHRRVYPKSLYITNGSGIILCTNFSQNYTRNFTVVGSKKENVHSFTFSLITYIGGTLSVVSLIILIALYIRIKETRKLPGKITISLCCTLLVFQVVFFFAGCTDLPAVCSAIAVVLHYLLLSFFTWMNVLAANMAYTFVTMESSAAVRPRLNSQRKKFLKCCCHGWITPLVWVGVCVALEWSQTIYIGYGSPTSCWISNGKALLYVVCLPVALILAINLAALLLCVVTIRRTQKNTQQVSKDSKPLDLPVLTLKLTVIFGLTWALGFLAASEETAFIWFPFVILNSLQGVLLFVALKAHTKVYPLLKGIMSDKPSSTTQAYTLSSRNKGPQ